MVTSLQTVAMATVITMVTTVPVLSGYHICVQTVMSVSSADQLFSLQNFPIFLRGP